MDRQEFAQRFRAAAVGARSFAQTLVLEPLPESLCFRVVLNASYDGNPLDPDERVYPEDSSMQRGLSLLRCTEQEVVELLWRDGLVPEWIDLSVCTRLGDATVIEACCCGRFTANAELLYHQGEGYPPFHVLGPTFPVDYDWEKDSDVKFSVFERAEACSLAELAALEAHADKPWSLTLFGPEFTDDALAALPRLPRLELFEVVGSPLCGPGLARLAAHPKLRLLRLRLFGVDRFSLRGLAGLAALRTVELFNLPSGSWAGPEFAQEASRVEQLRLHGRSELTLPSGWPRALTQLQIVAERVDGGPIPAHLSTLVLRLPRQDEEALERLLEPLRAVDELDLSSTPVTDAVLERLLARVRPGTLRLVDTQVSDAYLARLAQQRGLRLIPRGPARR